MLHLLAVVFTLPNVMGQSQGDFCNDNNGDLGFWCGTQQSCLVCSNPTPEEDLDNCICSATKPPSPAPTQWPTNTLYPTSASQPNGAECEVKGEKGKVCGVEGLIQMCVYCGDIYDYGLDECECNIKGMWIGIFIAIGLAVCCGGGACLWWCCCR